MAKGLISDTTMVANGDPEARELAVSLATSNSLFQKRVGIHLNITEGSPLTHDILNCETFIRNGKFFGKINRLHPLSRQEREAVYQEFNAQIAFFRRTRIPISHADSHHHIHTSPFIAPIAFTVCKQNAISKMRLHRNVGVISPIKKAGKWIYNQFIQHNFTSTDYFASAEDMKLFTADGCIEIMVHPDYNVNGILIDRIDYEDGIPMGLPLEQAVGCFTADISRYEVL